MRNSFVDEYSPIEQRTRCPGRMIFICRNQCYDRGKVQFRLPSLNGLCSQCESTEFSLDLSFDEDRGNYMYKRVPFCHNHSKYSDLENTLLIALSFSHHRCKTLEEDVNMLKQEVASLRDAVMFHPDNPEIKQHLENVHKKYNSSF